METLVKRVAAAKFPNWTQTPIPGVDISAAGLLALADLGTIAQRTRISGGASWLDALLLAPGLHYQQAADTVLNEIPSPYNAVEASLDGKRSTHNIANTATLQYLERVCRPGQRVVVDVGRAPQRSYTFPLAGGGSRQQRSKRNSGLSSRRNVIWRDQEAGIGWVSQVLYLASPLLTITAFVFMVLLREWWGVAAILGLMLSRILNIYVIKQRTKRPPKLPPPQPNPDHASGDDGFVDTLTEYVVDFGHGRVVCLRGLASDLQAITTSKWLQAQTHIEGYLEAAAKLTVYLVAAFSGNFSQVGSIIFLGLLLVTAGLLGLSNAHAKTFTMYGRLAAPTTENLNSYLPPRTAGDAERNSPPNPDSQPEDGSANKDNNNHSTSATWPSLTSDSTSNFSPMDSSMYADRP
ncbi:hypothetical protein F5Y17DRAFT_218243 [Xylariaceae sp. FL0594]|nr:hypothetical protein F5Y17DRAFT_218243 [Xylariaceae sp. FL0594]